ncbi:MAG: 50S ribosomal protein L24 [Vampirovibrio sp.]|nr:50S ribosomal protein L24 [Vampirovibrio sp.]
MVVSGKDKGKTGIVKTVLRSRGMALVEGVNMVKKAVRPNPMMGQQGGLVEMEAPIYVSKLMVYDLKSEKPTRVSMTLVDGPDGKKKRVRVSKKSGEQLD